MVNKSIHLVSIAAEYRSVEDIAFPPAGCLYVGGALKQAGFKVTVHHILSKEIDATVSTIIEADPMLVGFSILSGSPVTHSAIASRMIKELAKNIPIVWGGVHPSLMPDECLQEESVDFVVRGEGEVIAVELAECLVTGRDGLHEIDGLSWKNEFSCHHNSDSHLIQDLDQFHQDWSLVDPKRYVRTALDGSAYTSFITSRGCPFKCAFCYNIVFNRRRWRDHSKKFVIDEVRKLKELTGISRLVFNDDNFMVDEERAFGILEGLQEIGVQATWVEIRLDRFTDDLLNRLSNLGVLNIFVGWESGSDETLDRISKGFNRDLIRQAFAMAAKHGLEIDASAIVGFPFEKEQDWLQTVAMVSEIERINPGRNKFNIGVYVPYPGTPLITEALTKGFRFPENILDWEHFDILKGKMKLPWMTPEQVTRISRIDRYAKMLYLGGGGSGPVRMVRKILAFFARKRIEMRYFSFPWEAVLYDFLVRLYMRFRLH